MSGVKRLSSDETWSVPYSRTWPIFESSEARRGLSLTIHILLHGLYLSRAKRNVVCPLVASVNQECDSYNQENRVVIEFVNECDNDGVDNQAVLVVESKTDTDDGTDVVMEITESNSANLEESVNDNSERECDHATIL